MIQYISNKEDLENLIKSCPKVIIDFYADWCGPCQAVGPILKAIGEERNDLTIAKVNVDEAGELASEYGVSAIPLLLLYENGERTNEHMGWIAEKSLRTWAHLD